MKRVLLICFILISSLSFSQTTLDFDQYVDFIGKDIKTQRGLLYSKGWDIKDINSEKEYVTFSRSYKGVIKEMCTFYGYGLSNKISSIWLMVLSEKVFSRYTKRMKDLGFYLTKEEEKGHVFTYQFNHKDIDINIKIDIDVSNSKLTVYNFTFNKN